MPATAQATVVALPDRAAECRAAAAWARQQLTSTRRRGSASVPELGAVRETLAAMLDDALDPAAVNPALAKCRAATILGCRWRASWSRPCNCSAWPPSLEIVQEEFTALLHKPYWSADIGEADNRARPDARCAVSRADFTPNARCASSRRRRAREQGLRISQLLAHLQAFQSVLAAQPSRQSPSAWNWPRAAAGSAAAGPANALSSHEYQARRAFDETLRVWRNSTRCQGG